jgi:hypothetical protein
VIVFQQIGNHIVPGSAPAQDIDPEGTKLAVVHEITSIAE